MTEQLIQGTGISKQYTAKGSEPVEVLHDVNISVEAGTMVAIVGPSGAGKSTLLYCLSGLEKPSRGVTILAGSDVARLGPSAVSRLHRGRVGFIFQTLNLVPSLSANDNVTLPARFSRQRLDKVRALACLETLGVAKRSSQTTEKLSLGEQQRVAVARILYNQPQIIFADEPTGALDTHSGKLVLEHLRAAANAGQTVVMVTHDLEAASIADTVYVMRDGRIDSRLDHPSAEQVFEAMRPRSGADLDR
ncbi:MAG: ABC transporter ATP-binding protein [Brevibacterium aurantiacum]